MFVILRYYQLYIRAFLSYSLKMASRKPKHEALLHESFAARPVLYTIGVVGFVPFS
jgi:hypothetical protein